MPKKKIAQLAQSGKDAPIIVDLEDDEVGMYTGMMGGCCAVVVLWNQDPVTHRYRNVRGQHGAGGPGALNWGLLLQGVPTDGTSRVVIACAPGDFAPGPGESALGHPRYVAKVETMLAGEHYQGASDFHPKANALVDRSGTVEQLDTMGTDLDSVYEIRKPLS
jgi:hypothetical protein